MFIKRNLQGLNPSLLIMISFNLRVSLKNRKQPLKYMKPQKESKSESIRLRLQSHIKELEIQDIVYLEAHTNYTCLHTEKHKYITAKTLKEYAAKLNPEEFIRPHKSHIVNKDYIKHATFSYNHGELTLKNGIKISVARRRLKEVKRLLTPYRLNN